VRDLLFSGARRGGESVEPSVIHVIPMSKPEYSADHTVITKRSNDDMYGRVSIRGLAYAVLLSAYMLSRVHR